ncbi:hypothetical protein C5F47_06035 [Nitrosopumilus cobalaminigenes]|uniref:KAP NTPase domain-containing protein n=1 Tax=Nitrosopumilus cobalaminigenes TaxID=1470066 RepID=A0A7D5R2S4_9ARCH|nr:P-loop NTPase fold protein [Nitrosopumilus cobalaminigenes]QLH03139.1 hypothetical protein C5F47_06035 [Nitrosopumilus cobalaminigenes]
MENRWSLIKSISDEPTGETKYLGIGDVCNTLVNYIQSEKIVTPMSIAIHGQWGSGKTNLLKALQKNLHENKTKVVYFDAWKHESGNPSVALVGKIMKELSGDTTMIKNVVKLAADALIRKTLDMQLDEVANRLSEGMEASESLSEVLEKKINREIGDDKKLIVLIDDLDRCDIENTLQILSLLKLFLDIKNCVCIAAIDFHRVEQAWFSKYGIKEAEESELKKEGRQYLEKIFQIRVPIPHPRNEQKFEYIENLMKDVPREYLDLFVKFGPSNPRAIKRTINLISYRSILCTSDDKEMTAFIWTLLDENFGSKELIKVYDKFESEGGFIQVIDGIQTDGNRFQNTMSSVHRPQNCKIKFQSMGNILEFFKTTSGMFREMTSPKGSIVKDFSKLYSSTKQLQD